MATVGFKGLRWSVQNVPKNSQQVCHAHALEASKLL